MKTRGGLLIILLPFLVYQCGVFTKSPQYIAKPFIQQPVKNKSFYNLDSTKTFIKSEFYKDSKVIIVAIHGLGAHAGSFRFLQDYLSNDGISSLTMDLRGFGHWDGKKGDVKNIGLQLEDVHQIISNLNFRYPEKKIILLGESLGTSLAIWYANFHPEQVDGLILTSLVTSNGSGEVDIGTMFNLVMAYTFNPTHPVNLGYNPELLSNDEEFLEWAFEKDTLGTRAISPRYLLQANKTIKRSYKQLCTSNVPTLLLQGGKDALSSKDKIEAIINKCQSKSHIEYVCFPNMMHSIVNDINRDKAFNTITEWAKKY